MKIVCLWPTSTQAFCSSGQLVIVNSPKANIGFACSPHWQFDNAQETFHDKSHMFLRMNNQNKIQNPNLTSIIVASNFNFGCVGITNCRKLKVLQQGGLQWVDVCTSCNECPSLVQSLLMQDRRRFCDVFLCCSVSSAWHFCLRLKESAQVVRLPWAAGYKKQQNEHQKQFK